jgi:hypothetical protein
MSLFVFCHMLMQQPGSILEVEIESSMDTKYTSSLILDFPDFRNKFLFFINYLVWVFYYSSRNRSRRILLQVSPTYIASHQECILSKGHHSHIQGQSPF